MTTRRIAPLLSLCILAPASTWGQATPHGPEFQVNTYTYHFQRNPAIAVDGRGGFVVAWESGDSYGPDTDRSSVHAQNFDAAGDPVRSEIEVNTYTTSYQFGPSVAANAEGGFLVAWTSDGSFGTDSDAWSVQAQRYDADGFPVGSQFQVNTFTTDVQTNGRVAAIAQEGFIVAWTSRGSSGSDSDGWSIQAQRFDVDGNPLGGQFQVNTYTNGDQLGGAPAPTPGGGFIVVWTSLGAIPPDTDGYSVQAQRFDADGIPLGAELQINSYTTGTQGGNSAGVDAQGNFVVAWTSYGSSGSDTDLSSVQARRYDAGGSPLGAEFQVNTYTTGRQTAAMVSVDARGNFVVTWQSYGSNGPDDDTWSVQARLFDASGVPLGGEFQVNTYSTLWQYRPSLAADPDGNFIVAWQSLGSGGTDTDSFSVQAQRFDQLFRDDFETGDPSRWTLTIP